MSTLRENTQPSPLTNQAADGTLLHRDVQDLPSVPAGTIIRLRDGRLMSVCSREPAMMHVSADGGETWVEQPLFPEDGPLSAYPSGALLCASTGEVIFAFSNAKERNLTWQDDTRDAPGSTLPTYAMRSLDGGRSWQDVQKLHDEWTGANRDIIETGDGRIVFTSMQMLSHPGRHAVLTYCSDDAGKTWTASNLLDLGGNGHHDGATEATLVELEDGRLLKYIRTNWGQFWRALSDNGGMSWHAYGPTGIDASSSPGYLHRLASGRIALVWNRWKAEGADSVDLRGGDGIFSATPVSIYRQELSISFSEDECETWSPPVVVARRPEGQISYPYIFEFEPGLLWVTAHRWDFHVQLREENFLR